MGSAAATRVAVTDPPAPPTARPHRRRLEAGAVAEAAVLADVTVALCLVGWLIPFGGLLTAFAVVPLAAVAARHRLRAVVAAGIAATIVSLLVAGPNLAINALGCAVVGAVVGVGHRRGWNTLRTIGAAAVIVWPVVAAGVVGLLLVFADLRELGIDQIELSWRGIASFLRSFGLDGLAAAGDRSVDTLTRYWWITIPVALLVLLVITTWASRTVARPLLYRLQRAIGPSVSPAAVDSAEPVAPVPVVLGGVGFRYPGADGDALVDVDVTVNPGELVAIVGPNGSGKSTLARIVAGQEPTGGEVTRPGAAGVGRVGGTALVFQRPESQVLGVRVRDDVVWGLPADHGVDVIGVLDRVGLAELAARETSTLSGGELQRLAVAAALARRPRLLVSDESTAMVDADGRSQLMRLLRSLVTDDDLAVVHVTHDAGEAAAADRRIVLDAGRVVPDLPAAPRPPPSAARPLVAHLRTSPPTATSLRLDGVGHVYSRRTPWAHRALADVNLTVGADEGVLVVGANGSGKSTLAWIMAGLLVPTEGHATLDDRPLYSAVGRVGLAFQHARLQVLGSTVRSEVRGAAGVDDVAADAALRLVGVDPEDLGDRRLDELSGGQLRRVALAGIIARRPSVLILDEPLAGLDEGGRAGLVDVLAGLRQATGVSLVVVSHDIEGMPRVTERVVTLEDGRVVDDRDRREVKTA